jgi:hypothetical protein
MAEQHGNSGANADTECLNEFEVARALGVSVQTVRRWRAERSGPPTIRLRSLVRYPVQDFRNWVGGLEREGRQ